MPTDTDERAECGRATYQFDVPQGPIRYEEWLAYSFGAAVREELDRREERGYKHGDGEQTKLVTDGGRGGPQNTGPARSLSVGDDCPNCGRTITETASGGLLAYCWWCNDRAADETLVADDGRAIELRRAAVTVGIAPGCHGHSLGIDTAVVQSDGEVACPMCADWNEKHGGEAGGE